MIAPKQQRKVAILVTDGFEQTELTSPRQALREAGLDPLIVSPQPDRVRGWNHTDWGDTLPVDVPLEKAAAEEYAALVLPGGVMNPDTLRRQEQVQRFVRAFFEQNKPVAAICHGPWTLIDSGVVAGRRLTSYHTLQTDLRNAGAQWVDQEVVVDGNLITSRGPQDLEAFNRQLVRHVSQREFSQRGEEAPRRQDDAMAHHTESGDEPERAQLQHDRREHEDPFSI